MKFFRALLAASFCVAALASAPRLSAADGAAPARLTSSSAPEFTRAYREAFVSWALSRPEVRALTAGHRTRVLRVWTDSDKSGAEVRLRATVLLRDYDAGIAREISSNLPKGPISLREIVGATPSDEEIAEGMAIARRDPALSTFVQNPRLVLIGGFHNRSAHRDDPCAVDVCLEFAFMKPNYQGPARYIVVNLSRRVVAHHDFRGRRPGEDSPRMTERAAP
ncbi:MAG TPA: hypothetical protein VGQ75_02270 [Thermoanaerobaculia bacterium]|jgi:hypothetical protein|nr:hypothetical protein [Thermoanaerobaculia bacterium]HEV8611660.1 hypothetical protein [Thermoanaerobaculia bacterium]